MPTSPHFPTRRLTKLALGDLKSISRDPTLLAVFFMSLMLIALFVLFKDALNTTILSTFGLPDFSKYLAPLVIIMPGYLFGWVIGFLILEERDEGTLPALEVTMVGKSGIAFYRAALSFALTLALTLVAFPFVFQDGSTSSAPIVGLFAALEAAIITFAIPAISRNKVQGLAMTKVMNLFAMAPLLALVPGPWRYIAGIFPAFWIGEILKISPQSHLPDAAVLFLALLCHVLLLWFFFKLLLARSG